MTDKKQSPAYNAKILTTGIAIAATLGVQTAYAISSNLAKATAQIAQTEVAPNLEPNLVLPAPTQPGPATPVKQKNNTANQAVAISATNVDVTAPVEVTAPAVDPAPPVVVTPAPVAPVPTTAPATSASK